jgi:hypothetical protein
MTHFRWSMEHTIQAREMLERNAPEQEFIRAFNRTKASAVARIRYLDDEVYRNKTKARAARYKQPYLPVVKISDDRPRGIPESVLADAARRNALPRPAFGDPVFPQSALGKKMMGAEA